MIDLGPVSISLIPWILAMGAILLRLFGLLQAIPFVGRMGVPMQAKAFTAVFLGVAIWYSLGMPIITTPPSPLGWLVILLPEFIIGLGLGAIVRVVTNASLGLGQVVTNTIGLGFATFIDPDVGSTTSIGRLMLTIVGLLFIATDTHLQLFGALVQTFHIVGPGQTLPILYSDGLLEIAKLGSHFFYLSIRLAAPVMAASLMIYTVLAVVARVAPQMNLFAFGFIVTIPTGLVILMVEMPQAMALFNSELERLPEILLRWVATGRAYE